MARTSFRKRIILLMVAALGLVQALTLAAVLLATHRNVRTAINEDLSVAESVFERLFEARFLQLSESVQVLASDFGFKKAAATGDAPTIESALENHAARADADLAILMGLSGNIVATTRPDARLEQDSNWHGIVVRVRQDDYAADTIEINDAAYQLVAVPVSAPEKIAWLFMGFRVDNKVATFPDHAGDPAALMRRAEIAMYDAKQSYERIIAYEPGRDEGHLRQLAIVANLPAALAGDDLVLHYQPKADMTSGEIDQAEALIRWIHPQFGFIPPDEFITIIEQSGNISLLTEWVIDHAARQCRDWLQRGLDIKLSVNLSALDLLNENLPDLLQRALATYELLPRQLTLEITESAVMRDPKAALAVLARLPDAGLGLSIDDFGTGYSSLAQLKRLPVHELKIDKSFVMNLTGSSEDAVIVKSTIDLAHALGLKVVAEGVETADGWEALRQFNCDMAQGYLISKPLTARDFESWVRGIRRESGRILIKAA